MKDVISRYEKLTPFQRTMMTAVLYGVSSRCKNKKAYKECLQCGKCGRKFKNGILHPKYSEVYDD